MTEELNENELRRQFSLITLNDEYISGVAVSGMANQEEYGRLPENVYVNSVSNVPSELAYKELFLRELLSDEIPDNTLKFKIRQKAKRIIDESVDNLKVGDIFDFHGMQITQDHQDIAETYLRDLGDDLRGSLKQGYLQSYTDRRIAEFLSQRVYTRGRTLADLFVLDNPEEN